VRYRLDDGQFADTTPDWLAAGDVLAGLPVREFRSYHGRRHYSGWYWSSTMSRLVAYESRLELALILLADYHQSVTGIAAQPFVLAGADRSRERRHVPDLPLDWSPQSGSFPIADPGIKPALMTNTPVQGRGLPLLS
jgi:hypothetical protein